jgi:hypothetical protein
MGLGIFYSAFEGVRYSSSVGIIISDPTPGQDPQRFNQGLDDATAVLQAIKKEIDDYGDSIILA